MTLAAPVVPGRGRLQPLAVDEVRLRGGFWGVRQETNSSAAIPHALEWMERMGWVENFSAALQGEGTHSGMPFADSEIYKVLEAMAWDEGRSGSPGHGAQGERLAELVASVVQDDGYLATAFGVPGRPGRYTDLEWGHELYNYGHLLQAAVARARVGGSGVLVEAARRVADHVCTVFAPGGMERVGGHPEIEPALVELARVTGEQRYLDQAATFVERRGRRTLAEISLGRTYFQDETPVREVETFEGHAVRSLYLACGVVDLAVETGDDDLLDLVVGQWERTVARRTYLTGGMGSRHTGEAFGDDFELPPDRAYSETCAGIASVMLAWRLLLARGEPRFADQIERTLFNVVATSPGDDGRSYFYANPLHQRRPAASLGTFSVRPDTGMRAPWFTVACCPTNLARTLASLGGYVATKSTQGIQIHQYAPCTLATTIEGGRRLGLEVETGYPESGTVTIRVVETDGGSWTLGLRVPRWAARATLAVDGDLRTAPHGMVEVERAFETGDTVTLEIPVGPRWTWPDGRIDAVRGCVAVERGPVVLCAESLDLPSGWALDSVLVDPDRSPFDREGTTRAKGWLLSAGDRAWPYGPDSANDLAPQEVEIALVPYHRWGRRGPAAMRVWLPTGASGRHRA